MIPKNYLDFVESSDLGIINSTTKGITFFPNQISAIKDSILKKKAIWAIEMGLGKTKLTVGVANILAPYCNREKIILICAGSDTLASFEEHIRNHTDLRYICINGAEDAVADCARQLDAGMIDCIICTPSAWTKSLTFNILIYNNVEKFCCAIYDECSGQESSQGFRCFTNFARTLEYCFPANATPTSSKEYSLYSLLYMTNSTDASFRKFKRAYYDVKSVGENDILTLKVDAFNRDFGHKLINTNRNDVGAETFYNARFERVQLTKTQLAGIEGKSEYRADVLYGICDACPTLVSNPAFLKLIGCVTSKPLDENMVIFCRRQKTSVLLTEVLRNMGYNVFQHNGFITPTAEEKKATEDEFNETEGAIMITSAFTGLNLNKANYIVVYETPPEMEQYIARIARGYQSKLVNLTWIYYPEAESDTLYKALVNCIENNGVTFRDFKVGRIILNEIMEIYPNDARTEYFLDLVKKYNL